MSEFDLTDFLPYLLNQAAEVRGREFQKVYKGRYGMLRTEWRVLFHLGRHGPMTASAIVEAAQSHKTKISRAVTALEKKRFLRRDTMEHDRRSEQLSLTPAGQRAYRDLAGFAQDYDAKLMAKLGASDAATLKGCLKTLMEPSPGRTG